MKKLLAAVTLLAASTAQAETIHVDAGNCPGPGDGSELNPYCSIQTAIDNAVDGDEVVVAPGTYFEAINFNGMAITLRSSGGADLTIIDAQQTGTVVRCWSGEGSDTLLDGFTITGGNSSNQGGGMFNIFSHPTVTNCTFDGNTTDQAGGGIYNVVCNPTVTNCTFTGNSAATGGGMFNNSGSSPMVTNCTFTGNTADGGYEIPGSGGGMYNFGGSPTVANCTFSDNTAVDHGGGMYNFDFSSSSSITVTNCTFTGNSADVGGVMFNRVGGPTVTNCTFSGNTAINLGGVMYNFDSDPTVANCTFEGNAAIGGGGLYNYLSSPTVTNCILWGDSPNEIIDADDSISNVLYSDVQGGFPGIGNIDADPLFVDPGNGDYRLMPGSPCIDAGDNTAVPDDITTDLDGNPRFVDDPDTADTGFGDPPVVDMGAYEFQGVPCPWDLDGDGNVGIFDFLVLIGSFGSCDDPPADFDGDGCVTFVDLLTLLFNFGPCPDGSCPWDVDGDEVVNLADLFQVLTNLGPCDGCPEDINGDGVVDFEDVIAVATHFGPCP